MRCPNCGSDIIGTTVICPSCHSRVATSASLNLNQNTKVKTVVVNTGTINNNANNVSEIVDNNIKKKNNVFFYIVIVVGLIILSLLIIMRLIGHEEKDENEMSTTTTQTTTSVNIVPTKNKGSNSTLSYPLSLGQVTLASIYDEKYKKYTDVDVTALRYLSSEEATILADENSNRELIEGFRWHGFEYRVQLNDLDYLQNDGISPLLNSKIYNLDGSDFVNVNGVNYRLVTTPIIDGDKIHNNESAVVKLIYQIPIDKSDFVICFGYYKETMGCFR